MDEGGGGVSGPSGAGGVSPRPWVPFGAGVRALIASRGWGAWLLFCAVMSALLLLLGAGLVLLPWTLLALTAVGLRPGRAGLAVTWSARGWAIVFDVIAGVHFLGLVSVCMLSWNVPIPGFDGRVSLDPALDALWRLPAVLVAAALALPVRLVWLWVPALLLDGARGPGEALTGSARLNGRAIGRAGPLLAGFLAALPVATFAVAVGLGRFASGQDVVAYRMLGALFVTATALVLGRTCLAAAYLQRAPEPGPSPESPVGWRAVHWLLPTAMVAAALSIAATSAVYPRFPQRRAIPAEAEVMSELNRRTGLNQVRIPDTPLSVVANPRGVSIVANDGGGVGDIPLPSGVQVTNVKVARQGPRYWLEIHGGSMSTWRVPFDARGVRLDEQLSARFARSCPWPLRAALLVATFVFGWLLRWDVRSVAFSTAIPRGWRVGLRRVALWSCAVIALLMAWPTLPP